MSKKIKHHFFCANYTSLNQVLEILSSQAIPLPAVVLVVSEPSVYQLLKKYPISRVLNIKFVPYLNSPVVSSSPFTVLYHQKKFKQFFGKYFSKINQDNIYFFSQIFWETGLKTVQMLSQNNQVFFYSFSPSSHQLPYRPWESFLLKGIFGLNGVSVVMRGRSLCAALNPAFMRLNSIKTITPKVNLRKYDNLKNRFFGRSITKHKVLVLVDGDSDNRYIDPEKRSAYLRKVINFLSHYYPKKGQILLKKHPRVRVSIAEDLEKLVDPNLNQIPAELLIHPQLKFNIGIISTTLMYPKPPSFPYINISIYPLVAHEPDSIVGLRILSTDQIYLPKSFPQFKKLIDQHLKI